MRAVTESTPSLHCPRLSPLSHAMPRLAAALACALVATVVAVPAAAQWKWRDKGGHIQYSDLPPPANVPENDILLRPMASQRRAEPSPAASAVAPAASAAPAGKAVEPELEAKRRKAEQEEEAKRKAEQERLAATRADNCARARNYMRTLDEGMRIARVNDQGEREILDDKARAEEARRTREVIASDCK
jgi:hypothetical protein